MSPILKRAHRVLLTTVAAIFALTLLSPMAGLASTDLAPGDQAIISNPNGTGANLRSDVVSLDDSTIITEIPQGSSVFVSDGPIAADTGIWFWVSSDFGEGFVEASLMTRVDSPEAATEEAALLQVEQEPATTAFLPWAEPVDTGFIVDDNNIIPEDGLACRATATLDGEIIAFLPLDAALEVVAPRIHDGEQTFVQINCGDVSGFVNGDFVVLQSEQAEVPVEEAPEPAPVETEEPLETEVPVEEPVTTEEPVDPETPVDTPADTEEAPAVTEPAGDEPIQDEAPVETEEPVQDEAPVEDEEPVTEPTDEVVEDETPTPADDITDEAADDETSVPTEHTGDTEDPVQTEEPTEAAEDELPADESDDVETPVATDEPATEEPVDVEETPDATDEGNTDEDEGDAVPAPTENAGTPEPTNEVIDEPTTEPADDADATETPDAEPTEAPAEEETPDATEEEAQAEEPKAPATTVPAFDPTALIGSATVTGTNGDGLRCRVAPSDDAATLMVLKEGTKVSVFAEAVDGYLGIDCGGLQGFANVNYLWSGGAGDEEIQKADLKLVVTGTGNGLNCRTGAGTNFPVITVLRDGQAVTSSGKASNGWVSVTCGGRSGFIATEWVSVSTGGSSSKDSGTSASGGTATVVNTNGDGLYCRSGAGTSYSAITVLSPGQQVPVRGANQGAWVPVTCGGKSGFAHSDFMSVSSGGGSGSTAPAKPSNPGSSTGTFTVANTGGQGLNCRSGAGTSHGVITVLRPGQTVAGRSGSTNGWQAVTCGGKNGFVSTDFVTGGGSAPAKPADPKPSNPKPSNPGNGSTGQVATVVNTNGDGLYCRSGAGSGNSVITVLSPGQQVSVRGATSNGWVPVTCGGKSGWASGEFLSIGSGSAPKPADPKPADPKPSGLANGDHAAVSTSLNLRYEASLGSGVAAVAPGGTVVLITGGASNGFYPVNWDGLKGFMSGDYLAKTSKDLSKRGGSAQPAPSNPPTSGGGGGTATGNAMVDYAMKYLGYPYVWNTRGPASFDCSGFTYWVTKNVMGKDIGGGTWTQVSAGTKVSKGNLQPGDLVFFQNTYQPGLSHVGIYIGGGKFIHAENENTGVVISDLDSNYYGSRWYGAVRL